MDRELISDLNKWGGYVWNLILQDYDLIELNEEDDKTLTRAVEILQWLEETAKTPSESMVA